ncbi:FAD-binding and (Fe-S)-binding domain-containing protein [Robiginitalea sp. SC105]|uniref:FAD-binding and (Fe-S)-binding domain-containing protein n=1 Tax=Robiginitalea sp. SC105 TaxID=2762332 RepID=UPI001639657F|nr:FAD-binding and (Fe-S)-binding domain-containing protein [Robiginitalea sp. SC105]MBC2840498.1 FAD-binding protein [Robiginitalea sp. SC105]
MDNSELDQLAATLEGTLHRDRLHQALYATDASVYRIRPMAVAFPKGKDDIVRLIHFASAYGIGLIPRTAGTSLAGQCVGPGIVVDVSRHMTAIGTLDTERRTIQVQPGVVRDELNEFLKPHGLFFGPNTSTSNRCMIGGMVGNNSSGTTSIQYGVTRDKVASMNVILSDGSEMQITSLDQEGFMAKTRGNDLEASIYKVIHNELSSKEVQDEIRREFPHPDIHRRNTGYAVDSLLEGPIFGHEEGDFNLARLLCGSEGTLAFTTEVTLRLDPLPPAESAMIVPHYKNLEDCLSDVVPAMSHQLYLCEMMDKVILDCTRNNREQSENRFFVSGDPAALLMLEVRAADPESLELSIREVQDTLAGSGRAYAAPVLRGDDTRKAIELRKAGLGLLGNMVGDKKAVACIEDTAVALPDLKDFIGEFTRIMDHFGQQAVYYAHAGAGELHLRPILDLKKSGDVALFRQITTEVARLTKKYRGSFSGEHGDGIVRAEFIPMMIGEANYELLRRIKAAFDPKGIFNPGKIVDAFPMDKALRYEPDRKEPSPDTLLDFSDSMGILRAAEKCNGSGDCRKSHTMPGAMCPSYQATRREQDTTRGRANTLREMLTKGEGSEPFNHPELKEVFDLCLSCKACARECPSNVDVATLKAEFSYQYQKANGFSLRNRLFAFNTRINAFNSRIAWLANALTGRNAAGAVLKRLMGIARQRSLPVVSRVNFDARLRELNENYQPGGREVALYIDEFTRYLDTGQGLDALELLTRLGYRVELFYAESGRTFISKGFLEQARSLARRNCGPLGVLAERGVPVLGLEPSAVLTFRDEYKRFGLPAETAGKIAKNAFLIEEFLAAEARLGNIRADQFSDAPREIKIHNHCYQKALSDQKVTFDLLNLPANYRVSIIPSGCCGMAGSFGYEKEHYLVSMQVGELRLFPSIRKAPESTVISANGTSCRHQIYDGTGRKALHPVTILREALIV